MKAAPDAYPEENLTRSPFEKVSTHSWTPFSGSLVQAKGLSWGVKAERGSSEKVHAVQNEAKSLKRKMSERGQIPKCRSPNVRSRHTEF